MNIWFTQIGCSNAKGVGYILICQLFSDILVANDLFKFKTTWMFEKNWLNRWCMWHLVSTGMQSNWSGHWLGYSQKCVQLSDQQCTAQQIWYQISLWITMLIRELGGHHHTEFYQEIGTLVIQAFWMANCLQLKWMLTWIQSKTCPIFRSAMYCTVDLISDFMVNYIANQGVRRLSSSIMLSGDQNISYSGFLANCLSRTQTCSFPFFPGSTVRNLKGQSCCDYGLWIPSRSAGCQWSITMDQPLSGNHVFV